MPKAGMRGNVRQMLHEQSKQTAYETRRSLRHARELVEHLRSDG
jgi:hypothetical protein